MKFLADNKTLIQTTGDGWLQHWDAVSGRLLSQTRIAENASSAANSADGGLIAVGGWRMEPGGGGGRDVTNWFKLIESANGKEALKWEIAEQRFLKLAISPDGRAVAWGGDKVHVLDVPTQADIVSPQSYAGRVGSLTFSPDGKTLAIGDRGKLVLWNWAGKDEPALHPHCRQ